MPDVVALREQNDERERKLAMEGAILSPMARMAAQVEILVRELAPEQWENERTVMLDIAEGEIVRAKLTAGLGQGQQMSLADIKS